MGARFWYQNDLAGGKREFVLVDAEKGVRERAFDHEKLAAALVEAGMVDAQADRLPIEALQFKLAEQALEFRASNKDWRCDLKTYALAEIKDRKAEAKESGAASLPGNAPRRSGRTGPETAVTFVNRTNEEVEIFWLNTDGQRQSYGKLPAGERKEQHTYAGHVWEAVSSSGRTLGHF